MTVDEFIDELGGLGEEISNLEDDLLEIGLRIVNDMKARTPIDSGALRNSITSIVTNNSIELTMLAYGMFQNYGVKGTVSGSADPVPPEVNPQPREGGQYSFNSIYRMIGGPLPFGARINIHRFGLRPQRFFNIDEIATILEQELANRIDI